MCLYGHLKRHKNCKITVCNRSRANAEELASKFGADVIDYDQRYKAMLDCDGQLKSVWHGDVAKVWRMAAHPCQYALV